MTTATDVFALGSLAAYAATGRMPLGGESDAVVLYRVVPSASLSPAACLIGQWIGTSEDLTGTIHYEIQNGLMLFSDIRNHGTWTLLENGAYNNSGAFTIVATPERFSCSGNTLREYVSNGSVVSRRVPVSHSGQTTGS